MKKFAVVLFALLAGACATLPKLGPATDIHAFLVAVRDGDRAGFDAHVDRDALKANLRSKVMVAAAGTTAHGAVSLQELGALMAGPLVDLAADALLKPEVFKAVAAIHGYTASTPIPSPLAITVFVKPLGGDTVCVVTKRGGPCLLDFTDEGGVWKLTSFEGDLSLLRPKT